MSVTLRQFLLAAVFILLPGVAFAQLPQAPVAADPGPPPVPPSGPPPVPSYGPPPVLPQPTLQPPAPYAPLQPLPVAPPAPGTGLADPGRNGWPSTFTGPSGAPVFFLDAEVDVLKPTFKQRLQGAVYFPDGTMDTMNVPRADLGWTAAPEIELGYKLPDRLGEFLIGYRFLATDGTGTLSSDLGTFGIKSRLNMNVFDFDYTSGRYSPGPRWDMKWAIGARVATVYYDNEANSDTISEQASTYFSGAGAHASLDLEHQLPILPSFGFFAKGDAAVLVGETTQRFNESFIDGGGNVVSGGTELRQTQSVPTLSLRMGVSYTPSDHLRFTLGYEYEHWFSLGRIGDNRGELTMQGAFLRGEFDF